MKHNSMPVYTAIDIGSNTIRTVVARCTSTDLEILASDEALVRIGESVNATGIISSEKLEHTLSTLHKARTLAEQHNSSEILAVATEAIRKAQNRDEFIETIKRETGITTSLIQGDIESILTFYGASSGETSQSPDETIGVMDLGGGSMELVVARGQQIRWNKSLSIGSGWLYDRYIQNNPPSLDDIETAQTFLTTFLKGVEIDLVPSILIGTGGSANTLLRLAKQAFDLPQDQHVLSLSELQRCAHLLQELPAEVIAQRYDIDTKRARILSAGVLIIIALLERLALKELYVQTHGIREGLLLAYARYRDQWQQVLQAIADTILAGYVSDEKTFREAGSRHIRAHAATMMDWHHAVLKNEDIEAVHKMRVASRRLRAALDAYEAVCNPKAYKKLYRNVKRTADVLGEARNLDVMTLHLQERQKQVSSEEEKGLIWFVTRLQEYRQEYQKELEQYLQRVDEKKISRLVDACLKEEGKNDGKS